MTARVRVYIKILLVTLVSVGILLLLLLAPIDRTPLVDQAFYQKTKNTLASTQLQKQAPLSSTEVGWAEVNITPNHSMPMAGYRPRNHFESVHDSIYARVLVIANGSTTVAFISADLLLFPTLWKQYLENVLQAEIDFLYVGASHTHNSVGGWEKSWAGSFAIGELDAAWVANVEGKLYRAVLLAKQSRKPAKLQYGLAEASDLVGNRLVPAGQVDGSIRSLFITRVDSSKGIFFTFSAHANSLNKKSLVISGDYPNEVLTNLKERKIEFGMYMAGMVGSHRAKYKNDIPKDFELIKGYAKELSERILETKTTTLPDSVSIAFAAVPIAFGPAQVRVSKQWRIRPWLSESFLGALEGELRYLRIGNLNFAGLPCDFSGELMQQHFSAQTDPLIITSFNGNYVGYITKDEHYDLNAKAEIRTLNWVGPYYGKYFSEVVKEMLTK